jgi:hypothetical protein
LRIASVNQKEGGVRMQEVKGGRGRLMTNPLSSLFGDTTSA